VSVPDAVAAAVARSPPAPGAIARIVNDRHAYALRDEAGALVAEFVDDHVRDRRVRGVQTTWREWEFELGPAAPVGHRAALFEAVTRRRGGGPPRGIRFEARPAPSASDRRSPADAANH
jgi:hypothetical protein